jgi:cytochrome c-type biogenesis protein
MNGLLTLAFTAGLLAPVNPCGFALLPAYLGHTATEQAEQPVSRRLARALGIGAAVAVGFAATLSAAGLAISAGANLILRQAARPTVLTPKRTRSVRATRRSATTY